MEITLEQLLKGKATKIKDKEYYPTEAYVSPFLDRMQRITDQFTVKVELPQQITLTKDKDLDCEDITFNRVWIQALLPPEYQVENHTDVIGMVYGVDKGVAKFYRGGMNNACTNLCVFNPEYLRTQKLEPLKAINFQGLQELVDKTNEIKSFLNILESREFIFDEENLNEQLGFWVRQCISESYNSGFGGTKISTATAIKAFKLLFTDKKSPYYTDTNTNYFNVYNAFTEIISHDDRDIMNTCEKVLLLRSILSV